MDKVDKGFICLSN